MGAFCGCLLFCGSMQIENAFTIRLEMVMNPGPIDWFECREQMEPKEDIKELEMEASWVTHMQ